MFFTITIKFKRLSQVYLGFFKVLLQICNKNVCLKTKLFCQRQTINCDCLLTKFG